MIKLTKELLAIRTRHIINYDRQILAVEKELPATPNKSTPHLHNNVSDEIISTSKLLKRLCI